MSDSQVLAALETAVAEAPDNDALRLHLTSLLLEAGDAARALEHCSTVLGRHPDHAEALGKAATACEALGEMQRASAYRRLAEAVTREPAARDNVVQLKVVSGGAQSSGVDIEQSSVTLADVAGMDEVKRRLQLAFLAPMRNPEIRKLYGKSLRGGLLLYGPPGCGKTFIARATAGELGASFISVGLAEVLDMWLGQSERNLHEIFETARRTAPCVLFFDEIDALGRKRSLIRHSAEHNVVNQLLFKMDSVEATTMACSCSPRRTTRGMSTRRCAALGASIASCSSFLPIARRARS